MNKPQSIRLIIEGVTIGLSVRTPEEEKLYRDAAVRIQTHLQQLRTKFPTIPSDMQYYVMAMLDNTIEVMLSRRRQDTAPYVQAIDKLSEQMDEVLNS